MADRDAIREQFEEAFEGADYPVDSQMDFVPALPNGPATQFDIGDESITAMELNQEAQGDGEFPYDCVDELVDDLMDGLEQEGYV
jgi:hypothetical protein